jgi:phospholipid transport system substrate-binding protein
MYQGAVMAVESGSATEAIKSTIDQVLVILGDEKFKQPEHADESREALKKVMAQRFDYEEMGKRTLGREWKNLNADQQKEFVELFQQFLSNTYAGNVDGFTGEQVEYIKERRIGKFAEVQTKVISKKLTIPLDYRLLKNSNSWRVYDVIIDGVSLVKNFRGQFARIIKATGFQGLLEKLRSKTAKKTAK